MRLEQVRCIDINPDPHGEGYRPHEVEPLAADIREHGVLRPVLLRATPQGYVIVHGERRWRAAKMAGLELIPAWLVQDFEPAHSALRLAGAGRAGAAERPPAERVPPWQVSAA